MAFIRNTDKLIEGSSQLFFTNVRAKAAVQSDLDGLTAQDVGIKVRLDVIEGGAGVVGSIAKAKADAQAYADQKIAALVNSAPEVLDTLKELSDALGGDASFASTVAGQIGSVDGKVDQEILDRQGAISALQSSLNGEISDRQSADSALSLRLDALEADPVTKSYVDGQVDSLMGEISGAATEAVNIAAGYTDSKIGDLEGQSDVATYVGQLATSVFGQISNEATARENADMGLSNRLDTLEQDPTTKSYVDSQVSGEKDRAEMIESQLDGRLNTLESQNLDGRMSALEADPTTKSYVDSQVSNAMNQASNDLQYVANDVQGRLEILEADPTTKTYVDEKITNLINGAPEALDTLKEISDKLAEDESAVGALVSTVASNLQEAKNYADSMVSAEETQRMSEDNALSSRLDALEADPVTKSYVDGQIGNLEGSPDVASFVGSLATSMSAQLAQSQRTIGSVATVTENVSPSGDYNQDNFSTMLCDVSAGSITITLPEAGQVGSGVRFIIKDNGSASSSNYVRIQASESETLDGEQYYDIKVPFESLTIFTDGQAWYIV